MQKVLSLKISIRLTEPEFALAYKHAKVGRTVAREAVLKYSGSLLGKH